MTEIIKIEKTNFNNKLRNTVNARELHEKLGVNSKFNDWFKNRVNQYDFTENIDFIGFSKNLEKPLGGRPTIEYYISLDMAKELCMVENTEQGKKIRKYFIQCEEELKQQTYSYMIADPVERAKQWIKEQEQNQLLLQQKENTIKDKQETIELITANSQERTYKKQLRANIVEIIRKINKQTGAPFSLLYDELYKRFINNHHFEWKLDFYKSKNKLDYISNKHIDYLKELKDITTAMLN